MSQSYAVVVAEGFALIFACVAAAVAFFATLYDFRLIAQKASRGCVRRIHRLQQPHISVLVYAHNSAATIIECLRSVGRSDYKNYDVVVVDNKSTDGTRHVVRRYLKEEAAVERVLLYAKRKSQSQTAALQQAYARRYRVDDIVLLLPASSLISPDLLMTSAQRATEGARLKSLRLNEQLERVETVIDLVDSSIYLSRSLWLKMMSLLHAQSVQVGTVGVFYYGLARREWSSPSMVPCRYDADIRILFRERFSLGLVGGRKLKIGLVATIVMAVFLWLTYLFVIAATLESARLLVLVWSGVIIWCCLIAWSDQTLALSQKVKLTFSAPATLFLVYVSVLFVFFEMIWGRCAAMIQRTLRS